MSPFDAENLNLIAKALCSMVRQNETMTAVAQRIEERLKTISITLERMDIEGIKEQVGGIRMER